MTDKEKIIIDGVDVSKCEFYMHYDYGKFSHGCSLHKDMFGLPVCCDIADCCKDCYFKQLARKTQECKKLNNKIIDMNSIIEDAAINLGNKDFTLYDLPFEIKKLRQECEKLKKQLMQKSEVDMFFNTPIEGWSNDPCGICPHKAENEELKKEIINKNEKIKELRFSVSDLTNRLCCLNAEKSFRIVDLEQTLDEIEKELKEDVYCESQECGCDDFEECLKCTKEYILDIISRAKDCQ